MQRVEQAWAGIDAGKEHHHIVVIDGEGRRLLSRRLANDEGDLSEFIEAALTRADALTWAIDLADGPAALLITLLLERGQRLFLLPGIAVNRAAGAYRGEGKTDAKDAAIIADQARMRRDLNQLRLEDDAIAELRLLTTQRADLAADRIRAINRLRLCLLSVFPALERVLDFTNHGPLVLISHVQTPDAIRATGQHRLERWLSTRKVRAAGKLAATAVRAATKQHIRIRGEAVAADLVARLAATVLELNRQLAELDELISDRFRAHPHAEIITSMVGIGDLLGAEFLVGTGGTMTTFASASHLAGYAGLAPTPHDSGRRSGNLHRPRRYNRQLQRVFYTSALISIQRSPASKAFYDRKRAEGKRHGQAVLALARRRVDSCGPCSAMVASTRNDHEPSPLRLDKKIENHVPSTACAAAVLVSGRQAVPRGGRSRGFVSLSRGRLPVSLSDRFGLVDLGRVRIRGQLACRPPAGTCCKDCGISGMFCSRLARSLCDLCAS